MLDRKTMRPRSAQRGRHLRLEVLETRAMLSHPAVAAVNVAGTDWDSSFISYLESAQLGDGGYAIPVGSAAQLANLPWTNIDKIRITFTEDVNVDAADLSISGVNTTALAFSDFVYDNSTYTATWALASPISVDKLMLDLDAEGMDSVTSVSTEDALIGGWTDCTSTFPSGSGQTVEDFEFRYDVLPGDVNDSGATTISDVLLVRSKIGLGVNDAGYNFLYDLDGSGDITSADYNLALTCLGHTLPAGNPAGMTNDAPSTAGISDLFLDTDEGGDTVSLTSLFADEETASYDLVFSIIGNTNTSLFDSLSINGSGELLIDLDGDACGEAILTIRATDAGGLFVDTTVTINASEAPFITNFYCINTTGDFWTITGTITDNDDDVEGFIVTFGGVLASYNLSATVGENGEFTLGVELVGFAGGTGTAQTKDPHGILSNEASYMLVV